MITETERQRLLDHAVDAVNAWLDGNTEPGSDEGEWLLAQASQAVTRAVTDGQHIHTLITARVRCSGLWVAKLISDPDAYVEALKVERNAAANYMTSVMNATRERALADWGADRDRHGVKDAVAKRYGVSRPTLDDWIKKDAEATA